MKYLKNIKVYLEGKLGLESGNQRWKPTILNRNSCNKFNTKFKNEDQHTAANETKFYIKRDHENDSDDLPLDNLRISIEYHQLID